MGRGAGGQRNGHLEPLGQPLWNASHRESVTAQ